VADERGAEICAATRGPDVLDGAAFADISISNGAFIDHRCVRRGELTGSMFIGPPGADAAMGFCFWGRSRRCSRSRPLAEEARRCADCRRSADGLTSTGPIRVRRLQRRALPTIPRASETGAAGASRASARRYAPDTNCGLVPARDQAASSPMRAPARPRTSSQATSDAEPGEPNRGDAYYRDP